MLFKDVGLGLGVYGGNCRVDWVGGGTLVLGCAVSGGESDLKIIYTCKLFQIPNSLLRALA